VCEFDQVYLTSELVSGYIVDSPREKDIYLLAFFDRSTASLDTLPVEIMSTPEDYRKILHNDNSHDPFPGHLEAFLLQAGLPALPSL
jgi:hypothetical protein